MTRKFIVVIVVGFMLMAMTACGVSQSKINAAEMIVGEWKGEYDVAPIVYEEVSNELGVDVNMEPVYADMYFTFNEDGTCSVELDAEEFAKAVGKIAEPYVSAIIGFDTGNIVDLIMQYVAKDMDTDDFIVNGLYEVNNDTGEIVVQCEDESEITLYFTSDFSIEFYEEEIDQTIILEKIS